MRLILSSLLCLASWLIAHAQQDPIYLVDPYAESPAHYVVDPAGLLSSSERIRLDSLCHLLQDEHELSTAIVLLDDVARNPDGRPPGARHLAQELFHSWNVNTPKGNGGFLFLYVAQSQSYAFGADGYAFGYPERMLNHIADSLFVPSLQSDGLSVALSRLFSEIRTLSQDSHYKSVTYGAYLFTPGDSDSDFDYGDVLFWFWIFGCIFGGIYFSFVRAGNSCKLNVVEGRIVSGQESPSSATIALRTNSQSLNWDVWAGNPGLRYVLWDVCFMFFVYLGYAVGSSLFLVIMVWLAYATCRVAMWIFMVNQAIRQDSNGVLDCLLRTHAVLTSNELIVNMVLAPHLTHFYRIRLRARLEAYQRELFSCPICRGQLSPAPDVAYRPAAPHLLYELENNISSCVMHSCASGHSVAVLMPHKAYPYHTDCPSCGGHTALQVDKTSIANPGRANNFCCFTYHYKCKVCQASFSHDEPFELES